MNLQELTSQLHSLGIGRLTAQEEIYVHRRSQGMNPLAAARSAGIPSPQKAVAEMAERDDIKKAIAYMRELIRQTALADGVLEFTKEMATEMYLSAHAKAEDAATEIRATDSLVKLHGLATPEKKEIEITHKGQLQEMDDTALMEMAGQEIILSPEDYQVKPSE